MLNPNAFANASAVMVAVLFVVCRIVAWMAPNFIFQIGQSWFHTVRLESGQTTDPLSFGTFALGLISAVVLAWVVSFVMITLYNKWAGK